MAFTQKNAPLMEINKFDLTTERINKIENIESQRIYGELLLEWFCADEQDGVFIISRSENGKEYKIVAIKTGYSSNTGSYLKYRLRDNVQQKGTLNYRIMKVYKDGSYCYSSCTVGVEGEKEIYGGEIKSTPL